MSGPLVFLDTETVTLDLGDDVIWEIGAIVRGAGQDGSTDTEWRWQLRPNMTKADPDALRVNRFDERYELAGLDRPDVEAVGWGPVTVSSGAVMTYDAVATVMARFLDGAVVVGSSPWFDTSRLALFLRRFDLTPTWLDHKSVDIKALAAGYLAGAQAEAMLWGNVTSKVIQGVSTFDSPPWSSDDLCRACGVEPPGEDERHTALGDARWAMRLYDAITGGAS